MQIHLYQKFKKNFKKRISQNSSLREKYIERSNLFSIDRKNPILEDHKLTGKMKKYRSFSITGDYRVIYLEVEKNLVLFIDVGTHNQVYS